jgi:uncharacterized protein (TIGR03435 family)
MKNTIRAALILGMAVAAFSPLAWASVEYSFDEAVIRPVQNSDQLPSSHFRFTEDRFQSHNVTVRKLVEFAFHVEGREVVGLPGWAEQDFYDVQATISEETLEKLRSSTPDEIDEARRLMMRNLLLQRFGIVTHAEERTLSGFALVVSNGGPKMEEVAASTVVATTPEAIQQNPKAAPLFDLSGGRLHAERVSMTELAAFLGRDLGKSVEDGTHLDGRYNFDLDYHVDSSRMFTGMPPMPPGYSVVRAGNDSPDVMTAVRDQLGLQLKPQNVKTAIVAVDHIDRPSEN